MSVSPQTSPLSGTHPPQCPMRKEAAVARCPMSKDQDVINPRNNMPDLPQSRVANQTRILPIDRTTSSIPRALDSTYNGKVQEALSSTEGPQKWEYPSPQQFYNALIRKGWNTPEEHVEAMVLIHNRLNEDAWAELLKWETRFGGGSSEAAKVELVEFAGIHGHMSHKSWIYQLARQWFPKHFMFAPPFDRHDWMIRRPRTGKKMRYVIDYYSSRKTLLHEPDFHLDVRPASDSMEGIFMKVQYPIEQLISRLLVSSRSKLATHISLAGSSGSILYILVPLLLALLYQSMN